MAATISNQTGDGINDPQIQTNIGLPDVGSSVNIQGTLTPIGGPTVTITGSPLTAPSPPGSGSIYWIIQVNNATGAASIKQSNVSMPAADSGNQLVFSDVLVPANTDLAQDPSLATPDTY